MLGPNWNITIMPGGEPHVTYVGPDINQEKYVRVYGIVTSLVIMQNRIFIKGERLLSLINCPESATFEEIQTLARNIIAYRNEQDRRYDRIKPMQKATNNYGTAGFSRA